VPGVLHMRHTWMPEHRFVKGQPAVGAERAEDLQRLVDTFGGETIAACFVEPVVGAVGALVPPVGYLQRLREICDAHGILLVFDEVICGFGRTGKAFAAQSFGVTPDMITMAKALTNAAQPLGAVAVREDIHDTILDTAPDDAIAFFHGHTYSGHPVACAAGIATLGIFERERVFEQGEDLSPYFLDALFALKDIPVVTDMRGYGLLAALDLAPEATPGRRGYAAVKALWEAGLLLKITGDAILVAPPLVSSREHIDRICDVLGRVLRGF
jgi:beta-alanine--pyruvate transaminase